MIKKCLFCGQVFKTKPSHAAKRKCCSVKCFSALRKNNRTKECIQCGKLFDPKGAKKQRFCSHKCLGQNIRRPDRFCVECKNLILKPSNYKYCSKECYSKYQKGNAGNHEFWKTATKKEGLKRLREHFEKHVIKKDGCWGWNGSKTKKYKSLRYLDKDILAHRASWLLHKEEIPEGIFICHKCDNPECTNPDHLFLGTPTDNVRDMHKKGRAKILKGENSKQAKLTEKQVIEIKKILYNSNLPSNEIAKIYKVNFVTIHDIKHNKTWKHIKISPDLI